jgi:hypothetical protein
MIIPSKVFSIQNIFYFYYIIGTKILFERSLCIEQRLHEAAFSNILYKQFVEKAQTAKSKAEGDKV